jgi:hypothetical protein
MASSPSSMTAGCVDGMVISDVRYERRRDRMGSQSSPGRPGRSHRAERGGADVIFANAGIQAFKPADGPGRLPVQGMRAAAGQ